MNDAKQALNARLNIIGVEDLSTKAKKLYDTMSKSELRLLAGVPLSPSKPIKIQPLHNPPPPESLVDAKHDTVHKTSGKSRPGKSTKVEKKIKKETDNASEE